jgi:SAM-dependent methyltransferase
MRRKHLLYHGSDTARPPRILSARSPGFRNAYVSEADSRPLIDVWKKRKIARPDRTQRRVHALHHTFTKFFTIAEQRSSGNRYNTRYDLHRDPIYELQTARLRGIYSEYIRNCRLVLDMGCGTGKLDRRIVRTPSIIEALEAGTRRMGILGIDYNPAALEAAAAKKELLFEHHGGIPALQMEYLLMDLRDLPSLDLSRTCIGRESADLVLASDIFRWLPVEERVPILGAIREKMTRGGFLISMEFSHPPVIMNRHLSRKVARGLSNFGIDEALWLSRFYANMRHNGFEMVPDSKIRAVDEEHDRFPLLVSCVFRLR